jgi:roadblock/LC7 domain-containing protein
MRKIFYYGKSKSGLINEFIIRVKTDNAGTSASNQFTLRTFGPGYNFNVKWGDGVSEDYSGNLGSPGNIVHTYPSSGEYIVTISGVFPRIFYNNTSDVQKIIETINFGDVGWVSLEAGFSGAINNIINPNCTGNFNLLTSARAAWSNNTSNNFFPQIDFPICGDFAAAWYFNVSLKVFPDIDMSSGVDFTSTWREMGNITEFKARRFYNYGNTTNSFTWWASKLPTSDWSDILITQRANNSKTGINMMAGNSKYNSSASTARSELVSIQSWVIQDSGLE